MNRDGAPRKTLAEIISEKISEKRTEIDTQFSESSFAGTETKAELDPAVIEMYEGVGKVLERYRSGKIPKAFKVIAQFRNWEELLVLTRPDKWTAAAMYKATKIFTANLKEKMAQRFFNQILLPRVLDDIITYQRLNFHLYQALGKALFKPGAFFKGKESSAAGSHFVHISYLINLIPVAFLFHTIFIEYIINLKVSCYHYARVVTAHCEWQSSLAVCWLSVLYLCCIQPLSC